VDDAEISHARTCVFVYWADDVKLRDSCIHSFHDKGIHAVSVGEAGIVISGNTIERGVGLDEAYGNECIVLENVDQCEVTGNWIDLGGVGPQTPTLDRNGIRIQNYQAFCQSTNPPEPRVQSITGNRIKGPGASHEFDATGLLADWACGLGNRDVDISGNYFDGWSLRALWVKEALDVDASCNAIVGNDVGVHFDRSKYNSGWPEVRFRGNRIRPAAGASSQSAGTRTTNALAIDYGPSTSATGLSSSRRRTASPSSSRTIRPPATR